MWNSYDKFEVKMPMAAVKSCSHSGACDNDVDYWVKKIKRPKGATPEAIKEFLRSTGGWEEDDLNDDETNWKRIIWDSACSIKENLKEDRRARHSSRNQLLAALL